MKMLVATGRVSAGVVTINSPLILPTIDPYTVGNLDHHQQRPCEPHAYGFKDERADAYRRGWNAARR